MVSTTPHFILLFSVYPAPPIKEKEKEEKNNCQWWANGQWTDKDQVDKIVVVVYYEKEKIKKILLIFV